ncbi:hypothetical protein FF38_01885 [Lucilia cuprina]|uniref:BED-type domain-containing protein n=1 Tax=Lucilia cuprina TaxID=7375 RepID=A0A0L0BSK6_LUCCU|nr:hypothetical protein FF38_01885 [Lucilia cuprina]
MNSLIISMKIFEIHLTIRKKINLNGWSSPNFKTTNFVIKDTLKNTYFPRKCEGVIAVCLICGTKIKGSKKVASNFLQHYRNQHVKEYKEFKHMKSDKKSSKDLNKKKFDEKVLKFIRSSFSPMSAVATTTDNRSNFIKAFKTFGVKITRDDES